MRNRFFFIILTTLILSAVGINFVHVNFFKSQRLKLIDKQIAESSELLINSEEFEKSVRNPVLVEESISKVLKGARIGKVFIIRDRNSKILFQSFNVGLLEVEVPLQPEWVAVQTKDEYVRVRNTPLTADGNLVLQVGLVLDRNFLNWEIVDIRLVNYIAGIVLSLFLASVLLTLILLSPLRLLITHLQDATSKLVNMRDVRPLPSRLLKYTEGFWAHSDEFSSLLSTVQKLIDRINSNYKLTRSWTLQMAHELKTPLAIARVETETHLKAGAIPQKYSQDILLEIKHMAEIISQFLEWAELENSQVPKDLHSLRIKSAVLNVVSRLEKMTPHRMRLNLNSDFTVFSNPSHLDQLITNIVTNAIKFSTGSAQVDVGLYENRLVVRDYGKGIPPEVKERLGQPFNLGSQELGEKTGNGLGLAWILAVVKLYGWDFDLISDHNGTQAIVKFPLEPTT